MLCDPRAFAALELRVSDFASDLRNEPQSKHQHLKWPDQTPGHVHQPSLWSRDVLCCSGQQAHDQRSSAELLLTTFPCGFEEAFRHDPVGFRIISGSIGHVESPVWLERRID
jgi:hypothetical protein